MHVHIRIHQASITLDTLPKTWVGECLLEHVKDFSQPAGQEPSLILDYRGAARPEHRCEARAHHGEITLRWSPPPPGSSPTYIAVETHVTSRSIARGIRMTANPSGWRSSRRRLLLRYGLEHPVTAHLQETYGYASLHAAATSGPRGGVLILGSNNSGKSTLACSLVERYGHSLLADNFCPTDGNTLLAFPGSPRAKANASLPLLRPVPAIANHLLTIVIQSSTSSGLMVPQAASLYLGKYVDREREDHRGSAFYSTAYPGGLTRSNKLYADVIGRLISKPVVIYNWSENLSDRLRCLERYLDATV